MNLVAPRAIRPAAPAATPAEAPLLLAHRVLRVVLGAGAFLAGLDKFFDRLATWSMYVSPLAERLLPVGDATFLHAVGVAEMILGVAILAGFTRVAASLLAAWLLAIAANLAAAGTFWDLVLRDLQIAAAAFALGRLGAWRERRGAGGPTSGGAGSRGPRPIDLGG